MIIPIKLSEPFDLKERIKYMNTKIMVRSFLPVGQGAFYNEEFFLDNGDKINVVYDCGSSSNKKRLKTQIKGCIDTNTVDALFISHFHNDHVNGIETLFKYYRIKKIFLPVLTPSSRDAMLLIDWVKGRGGIERDLVEDPVSAIQKAARTQTPEIVFVDNYKGNKSKSDETRDDWIKNKDYKGKISYCKSGENVAERIIEEGNKLQWKLIPYNIGEDQYSELLIEELGKAFNSRVTISDIFKKYQEDSASRKTIEDVFDGVIKRKHFNTNTMTLFSGAALDGITQNDMYYPGIILNYPSGCLYLGDYNSKDNWDELEHVYKDEWDEIGCIQVPHHGSRLSFNEKLLDMKRCFVISAGYNNNHGHPHSSVMKAFFHAGIKPNIVTEMPGSAYYTWCIIDNLKSGCLTPLQQM